MNCVVIIYTTCQIETDLSMILCALPSRTARLNATQTDHLKKVYDWLLQIENTNTFFTQGLFVFGRTYRFCDPELNQVHTYIDTYIYNFLYFIIYKQSQKKCSDENGKSLEKPYIVGISTTYFFSDI